MSIPVCIVYEVKRTLHVETTTIHNLVSLTELNEFFTQSCQTDWSFVHTSTVKGLLYLKVQIKFCFYFVHSHPFSINLSIGDVQKKFTQ